MDKIGIILFARYSSSRLKGKVLKKFNDKTLLDCIMVRLLRSAGKIPIVVATSNTESDQKIVEHCIQNKYVYFRGSLKNVIKRTKDCCSFFNFKAFIRICCDRPFIDYTQMEKMISEFLKSDFDIVTNTFPRTFPKGLTIEIAKTNCFDKIKKKKIVYSDFEHIFNYFYRNNSEFKIKNFASRLNMLSSINLSIDTKKDFNFANNIYKKNDYDFLTPTSTILKQILKQ